LELEVKPSNVLEVSCHSLQGKTIPSDHKAVWHTRAQHRAVHGWCLRMKEAAQLPTIIKPSNCSLPALLGCVMQFCTPEKMHFLLCRL
jgi:hypothetical protein